MKAIVLAAGTGSRLSPITNYINKHLLPLGRDLAINYSARLLDFMGVHSVCLVVSPEFANIYARIISSWTTLDTYLAIQPTPTSVPHAITLAKDFVSDDTFVLLADNIFDPIDYPTFATGRTQPARIHLKRVPQDSHYIKQSGVFDHESFRVIEKPTQFVSNYVVTGAYVFDHTLVDRCSSAQTIADVINSYAETEELSYTELQGYWFDMGTDIDGYYGAGVSIMNLEK